MNQEYHKFADPTAAANAEGDWRALDLPDNMAIASLASRLRASLSPDHVEQDPEWQSLECDPGDRMVVLVDENDDGLQGTLSGRVHNDEISFQIGGITLLRKRVRRMTIREGIVTRRPDPLSTAARAIAAAAEQVTGAPALFLEAVPEGSTFQTLLTTRAKDIRGAYRVLPWAETRNSRIKWDGNVEAYLKTIGKGTRRDLKRCATDLMSDPAHKCEVKRFSTPAELDVFISDGTSISDRTYQKRQLGLGLSRGGKLEAQLRFAAAQGGFLGHILYIDGAAVAFQYGFLYNKIYFIQQVGYDPAWGRSQPGSVLHLEALRDLEHTKLDVKLLDFGQGLTLFKERTTNERRVIVHYYLFRRSAQGFVLYLIARTMGGTKRLIQKTVDALQLREAARNLMKRLTGHGHMR